MMVNMVSDLVLYLMEMLLTYLIGLICWKIVLHGFIDGYSRLITTMRASNNNHAETVLDVFLDGVRSYGLPSHVQGDHGVENLQVAAFMENHQGTGHRSYIFGQ